MRPPFRPATAWLLTLAATLLLTPIASAAEKPNILFIAIDDLNDWVTPLSGHPQVKTPHMDRIARRGVTFTNAHCQSPLCNPSRTSLMSGLRPTTTGVYALQPWLRTVEGFEDWVMLPQYFEQHGYVTMSTGKVYHDAYPPAEDRRDGPEFTRWGFKGGFHPRPDRPIVPDATHALVDWGVFPDRDEQQDDYQVASWAVEQLENPPEDKPFFLAMGIRHPHVPLYATQQWFDLYPPDTLFTPPVLPGDRDDTPDFSWYLHWKLPEPRLKWVAERRQWINKVRAYLASVSFADAMVGRALDALEASGEADNTIVVLWSDHGYHLGEKLITGKNTLWRESTRVPLLIAGPGVAADVRCDQPAELVDLYPTLVELAGLPDRDGLDGLSLVPQLQDPTTRRTRPAITTHGPSNHSVVTTDWRYIQYADGSRELYDLKRDPREWHNLARDAEYEAKMAELAEHLPAQNAAPVPGSKTRLVELKDGTVYWQGEAIKANAPPPANPK